MPTTCVRSGCFYSLCLLALSTVPWVVKADWSPLLSSCLSLTKATTAIVYIGETLGKHRIKHDHIPRWFKYVSWHLLVSASAVVLFILFQSGSHASQDGLQLSVQCFDFKLLIFLNPSPESYDYRCVLVIEPRASCILGKHSPTELHA